MRRTFRRVGRVGSEGIVPGERFSMRKVELRNEQRGWDRILVLRQPIIQAGRD